MAKAKAEIRSLTRSHTEAAIKVLVGVMDQPKTPPAARVSAAIALLDRGRGKVAVEGGNKPIQHEIIDDRELDRQVALVLYRARKQIEHQPD